MFCGLHVDCSWRLVVIFRTGGKVGHGKHGRRGEAAMKPGYARFFDLIWPDVCGRENRPSWFILPSALNIAYVPTQETP